MGGAIRTLGIWGWPPLQVTQGLGPRRWLGAMQPADTTSVSGTQLLSQSPHLMGEGVPPLLRLLLEDGPWFEGASESREVTTV